MKKEKKKHEEESRKKALSSQCCEKKKAEWKNQGRTEQLAAARCIFERRLSVKIKLDEGAYIPTRAHKTDAGLDIRAKESKSVLAGGSTIFHTGVHIQLPKKTAGILISKSGLNVNHDITSTGLIDEGYSGEIVVKLFNHGAEDYIVRKGEKISQLVIVPVRYEKVRIVDSLTSKGERGNNGFGSTGR